MAHEADFYTAEEAAKVLGIPVRRVFGMLCGGKLEGHQDEWARWLVPSSALQEAQRDAKPFDRANQPGRGTESHAAMEEETRVQDAGETTVLSDGRPFSEPNVDARSLDGEVTTQETDEVPAGGSLASLPSTTKNGGAETLPLDGRSELGTLTPAPDDTVREITERLAAAAAKTRELRGRLELAEATEAELRERLERERRRIDGEGTEEQHGAVAERLEKGPADGRGDGFWRGLFGG